MIDVATYRARIGSFHAHSHGNSGTSGTHDETRDRKYLNSLKLSFQLRKKIVKKTEKVIYPTIPRTKNSQHANETNRREEQNAFYFVFLYSKLCNLLKVLLKYKFQALFSLLVFFVISMLLLRAGVEPNPGPEEIGYNEMDTVCRMIGDNWKKLTRRLFSYQDVLLTQNTIINCDKESDVYDKCFEMLLRWRQECHEPTKDNLFQALQDLNLTGILDHLLGRTVCREGPEYQISEPPNKISKIGCTPSVLQSTVPEGEVQTSHAQNISAISQTLKCYQAEEIRTQPLASSHLLTGDNCSVIESREHSLETTQISMKDQNLYAVGDHQHVSGKGDMSQTGDHTRHASISKVPDLPTDVLESTSVGNSSYSGFMVLSSQAAIEATQFLIPQNLSLQQSMFCKSQQGTDSTPLTLPNQSWKPGGQRLTLIPYQLLDGHLLPTHTTTTPHMLVNEKSILRVQTELKIRYATTSSRLNPIPGLITDPPNIQDVYTNLHIIGRTKSPVKLQEVVTFSGYPQSVLVQGAPGIGKSTLCRKIVYDWAEPSEKYWVHEFKLVFLIEVRQLLGNITDAIFQQLLPEDITQNENDDLQTFIQHNQHNVLFVIDGYDELGESVNSDIEKLIQRNIFSRSFVIVTSRPTRVRKIEEHFTKCLVNKGYTIPLATKYIEKYFKSRRKPKECYTNLLSKAETKSNIKDLIKNPLNVVLLCLLWEDNEHVMPETMTELYSDLTDTILRRYCARKNVDVSVDTFVLPQWCSGHLTCIQKIAFKSISSDVLAFETTHEMLQNIDKEIFEVGFLNKELSSSRIKRCDSYTFPHKTFQEFFAAKYILNQTMDFQEEFIRTNTKYLKQLEKFSMVFQFLTGLCTMQNPNIFTTFSARIFFFENAGKFLFRRQSKDVQEPRYKVTNSSINVVADCLKESKYDNALGSLLVKHVPSNLLLDLQKCNKKTLIALSCIFKQCENLNSYIIKIVSNQSLHDSDWRKKLKLLVGSLDTTPVLLFEFDEEDLTILDLKRYFVDAWENQTIELLVLDENLTILEQKAITSKSYEVTCAYAFQYNHLSESTFSLHVSAFFWNRIRNVFCSEYTVTDVQIKHGAISLSVMPSEESSALSIQGNLSSKMKIQLQKLTILAEYNSMHPLWVREDGNSLYDIALDHNDWRCIVNTVSTDKLEYLSVSSGIEMQLQEILEQISIDSIKCFSFSTKTLTDLQLICDNPKLSTKLHKLSFNLDSDKVYVSHLNPSDLLERSRFCTLFRDMCNIERLHLHFIYSVPDVSSFWLSLFDRIRHLHLSATMSCNVPSRECDLHSEEATSHGLKYLEIKSCCKFGKEELYNLIDCITSSSLKECHVQYLHIASLCLSRSNCNTPLCSEIGLEMKVIDLNALEDKDLQAALSILARGDDITRIKRHLRTILEGDSVEWTLCYHFNKKNYIM